MYLSRPRYIWSWYVSARSSKFDANLAEDFVAGWLENVTGLSTPPKDDMGQTMTIRESNLATCLNTLDALGFMCFAMKLDPSFFGHPQSRPRYWMPIVSKAFLEKAGMTEDDFYKAVTNIMDRFIDHGMVPLKNMFLPDDDVHIMEMINLARGMVTEAAAETAEVIGESSGGAQSSEGDANDKWPGMHFKLGNTAGMVKWWKPPVVTRAVRDKFPCLNMLPARAIDGLSLQGVTFPESSLRLFDTTQSAGRMREVDNDRMMCITPKMRVWMTSTCRVMHGLEGLNMQGIYYTGREQALEQFTSDTLMDLAGNAFHAGCCLAAMMGTLVALAMGSNFAASPPTVVNEEADAEAALDDAWGVTQVAATIASSSSTPAASASQPQVATQDEV